MRKYTKVSVQWFYDLLERGECDIMDFKEQLEDKRVFGKSLRNFAPNYEEMTRDVVAFANLKGGFLFVGIVDGTKEIYKDFQYNEQRIFELIKQVQDRTFPTITLIPHNIRVDGIDLLVLEIPFSPQMHRTSKGEFLIRSNNGNRAIEPYEMATVLSEKGMIIYDQKTWNLHYDWFDETRAIRLQDMIRAKNAESPFADKPIPELLDSLGMTKEEEGRVLPTTTGLLFVGNDKALRELPFYEIKYIRYESDGSYRPYEYKGNIIEVAQQCFAQLKAEIRQKEFVFGLYREYVEDYSEIVLRELLINSLVHRDISRQQIIEIRKYEDYIEFESPGTFPQGITVNNYLRKTNPRNPNVIDIMREIGFAEKAGSGFDKIFTELLSKGKHLPEPEETDTSVIFRIRAEICMEKLIELSLQYQAQTGESLHLDQLLVLNEIVIHGKIKLTDLERSPHISTYRLKNVLERLQQLEFIEATGKTSGQSYILHMSKRKTTSEKIEYVVSKKQEKARQEEAILRYLESIETINNTEARQLLKLSENMRYVVTRLFNSLMRKGYIEKIENSNPNNVRYKRKW